MARRTKKELMLASKEDDGAPFLFDYDSLPVRPDIVQIVAQNRYHHTGARLLDNEELTARVVERLSLGHGVERIARDLTISPHSIRAARAELVSQGKMAGFVKRFVVKIEDILEAGLSRYMDGILSGEVHPGQLPVGLGILSDKRSLALGEPTAISLGATAQLRPDALAVQTLNDWVSTLPSDGESIGKTVDKPVSHGVIGIGATVGAADVGMEPGQTGARATEEGTGGGVVSDGCG